MDYFTYPVGDTAALVTLLAKATLLLILAFGAATALQRATAGARHLVWAATLGAVLILPAIVAWSPLRLAVLPAALLGAPATTADVPVLQSGARATISANNGSASVVLTAPSTPPAAELTIGAESTANAALAPTTRWIPYVWEGLLLAWIIVAVALGGWLLMGFLSVNRIVRRATALDSRTWSGPLYELADRLGIDRTPRIVRSTEVKMPFAAGLVTPTIVLPAESDGWDDERRQAVLMHELAHIRRNDLLGHTLGRIACAIYWFHPLVWRAARRLRIESERACDDLALMCGLRASNYAEHLLEIVTSVRVPGTPSVAIPMADRKEFEGRMLAILDPEVRRRGARGQSLVVVAGLAIMAVLVGGAVPAAQARAAVGGNDARLARVDANAALGDTTRSDSQQTTFDADGETRQRAREAVRADAQSDLDADVQRSLRKEMRTETRLDMRADTRIDTRVDGSALMDFVGKQLGIAVRSVDVGSVVSNALAKQLRQGTPDQRTDLLLKVLRTDTSAALRRVAAWGLAEYSDHSDVSKALAEALRRERDTDVREMIVWALANADDSAEVLGALTSALKQDSDAGVREMAAWALGSVGAKDSEEVLAAALSDASPRIRTTALWAIGNCDGQSVPPAVLRALGDSAASVRQLAAWVIFQREDESAVPALERALGREKDRSTRTAFIRALGAIGGASAPALARLLDSSDPEVRAMVVNALAGRGAGGPWPMPMPRPRPFP
jgi:beta-lactamase regulating signal transducer with metallopeptidase domain